MMGLVTTYELDAMCANCGKTYGFHCGLTCPDSHSKLFALRVDDDWTAPTDERIVEAGRQIVERDTRIATLESQLADARELLRKYQFSTDNNGTPFCRECGVTKGRPCAPDCRLAAFLEADDGNR